MLLAFKQSYIANLQNSQIKERNLLRTRASKVNKLNLTKLFQCRYVYSSQVSICGAFIHCPPLHVSFPTCIQISLSHATAKTGRTARYLCVVTSACAEMKFYSVSKRHCKKRHLRFDSYLTTGSLWSNGAMAVPADAKTPCILNEVRLKRCMLTWSAADALSFGGKPWQQSCFFPERCDAK